MASTDTTSQSVRSDVVEALRLDLVGPDNGHAFAAELLPESPSRWYLTGFLVPADAPVEQRADATVTEEIDSGGEGDGTDDGGTPDRAAARRSLMPSSMGLSLLVAAGVNELKVTVCWGDYAYEGGGTPEPAESGATVEKLELKEGAEAVEKEEATPAGPRGWRRTPNEVIVSLKLPASGGKPADVPVPGSGGLSLVVTVRDVAAEITGADRIPAGTRPVAVFLVNRRKPDPDRAYRSFAFQTALKIESAVPFTPRPDLRNSGDGPSTDEWDEQVADVHYRDVFEYAVGHGVSAVGCKESDGTCRIVRTTWIPTTEVERVEPSSIADVELGMEVLGNLTDGVDASAKLMPLVKHYREWIAAQKSKSATLKGQQLATARDLMVDAEYAATRIQAGIELLAGEQILDAFRIANRTMAQAARQRTWQGTDKSKPSSALDAPRWRPFQLAFILMTLRSIVEPEHSEREAVDLLFFPTGGGKTEAYLGLAAFTLVLRRLRNAHPYYAGVSVLMRYTLRLLTLDQLGRASGLICALELEREKLLGVDGTRRLGDWPFEIGLWVGQAATPNRMGGRGQPDAGGYTAYTKTNQYKRGTRKASPIPLENCPWCGEKFEKDSFRLVPTDLKPLDLRIHCVNHHCAFCGDRHLPIVAVDEPLYRRVPAFVIATVDKFAALPWTGETGALFGLVDRYDEQGFYGTCSKTPGTPLSGPLPGPDLIIQDELHLISGPLGTIAGVYETAIDALASRTIGSKVIRAKIIASTATVRRADTQILALFGRKQVTVFPPPGPDRRDSFFAHTEPPDQSPARLYVGVAAQGKSLKVVLLRSALAILSAAEVAYEREGGARNKKNPADPYMTLLGYFNSLRELGGSRRIIEDEVRTRLSQYARRRRRDPVDTLFTDRTISYDVLELTSRVPTDEVAAAKRRLALSFGSDKERVDVALATNMISVGLDIIRLGLMVVLGQPKSCSEYIQATSRVGRDREKPGLVVALLNVHKPRDRSHYERFDSYHSTFYRNVEATSVTPFSPRALDRALPAALVAMCRHGNAAMTPPIGASEILSQRLALSAMSGKFAERAENHDVDLSPAERERFKHAVRHRSDSLLDDWLNIAEEFRRTNTTLQYQEEVGNAKRLLFEFLNPELAQLPEVRRHFRANRSMRDVEPSVDLFVKNLNDWEEKR
jgi:hypothetical protein